MRDRITVVEQVTYQQNNREPNSSRNTYVRYVESAEQLYHRIEVIATEEWQPLIPNGCWILNVGCLLIISEGTKFILQPTEEEQAEADAKILEITDCRDNSWLVYPKETFRGSPTHPEELLIRSQSGEARYTITVFPK